ncbi:MAG: hypothetical protein RSF67_02730 [Clostridia bacterium]
MLLEYDRVLNIVDNLSIEGISHYIDVYRQISDTRQLTHKEKTEIQLLMYKLSELNKICYNILKVQMQKETSSPTKVD